MNPNRHSSMMPAIVSRSPLPPVRRIVTGHDLGGRAVIASDGALPTVVALAAVPGTVFHELWSTESVPASIDNGPDPTLGELRLAPPRGGTRIRIVDIPPDTVQNAVTAEEASAAFAEIGGSGAHEADTESPHALMHRTETVDYGIVLSGEVWLVVDEGETRLLPGDVVVQRGTSHAWSNRTEGAARMAFVLVDGVFADDLRRTGGEG
jgi:hypothetical protein